MRAAVLVLTLLGLGLTAFLLGRIGLSGVLAAVTRIGPGGFLLFCLYSVGVLAILGAAQYAVAPGARGHFGGFVWGRATREAATDLLPFAQLGGIVVGARTVVAGGVPAPLVYASIVADLTTEMAAQLVFTLAGVAMLGVAMTSVTQHETVVAVALGAVLAIGAVGALVFGQRPLLALGSRLAGGVLPASVATMAAMRAQLDAIYAMPRRLLAGFALNLLAWLASAGGAWLALRLAGIDIPLWVVLTIESLIFALRSAAFAVPGALGLQEGAYVLLAPLFGVPPEIGLALSLLKRARDVAIAVPVLLIWQVREGGALLSSTRARPE